MERLVPMERVIVRAEIGTPLLEAAAAVVADADADAAAAEIAGDGAPSSRSRDAESLAALRRSAVDGAFGARELKFLQE
jgi:hypothetical protein